MIADLHVDPVYREEIILRYLRRTLGEPLAGEFEDHYLNCEQCFEEMGASQLLVESLRLPPIASTRVGDIAVLRFPQPTQLLGASLELTALIDAVRIQNENRVLIDLSTVSRIDSAGLGVLMNCYCHTLKSSGSLKLLNPTAPVKAVLKIAHIDSVLETFEDETAAIESFS
ncbi:MAG TPA: STAS domain-containing protein [Bryobacteraceae bacterium]|nr:STAS domain-containing protein [Bryobacteraceae bacterium]